MFAVLAFDVPTFLRNKRYALAIHPGRDRRFSTDQRKNVLQCIATRGYQLDGAVVRIQSATVTVSVSSPTDHTRSDQEKNLSLAVQAVTEWASARSSTTEVSDLLGACESLQSIYLGRLEVRPYDLV